MFQGYVKFLFVDNVDRVRWQGICRREGAAYT